MIMNASTQNNLSFGNNPHEFDPSILREYDIRGIVDETLSAQDAYALGLAFGTMLARTNANRVAVGYDGRPSSPSYSEALVEGLKATGMAVDIIGVGPTPMLYFAVKDLMEDGGIMITGSHNPSEYNGFKIMLRSGPLYGDGIQELGRIAASGDFIFGEGSAREIDVRDVYVDRLIRDFSGGRELKVAWDAGNGAAGEIMHKLAARLPGEHILLYDDIDGTFPNHHPDPTVDDNLKDLQQMVREQGCDLGIAFDGDGDRIGVIDEAGKVIRCDMLMSIYARGVLNDLPDAPIIGDVKCSGAFFDEVKRLGGEPVMWKTGHSLVKAKMSELRAPLAGELSGHIFFADKYYGFDDALYCAIRLLNEIGADEIPLSGHLSHLPKLYNTPEVRFTVDESEKFGLVDKIKDAITRKAEEDESLEVNDIDGVRVSTEDGWWLVRPSNTQNVVVIRLESTSQEGLDRLKKMVSDEMRAQGQTISFN